MSGYELTKKGLSIIDVPQGTDEWKMAKLGMASASNFDAVLAEGKGKDEAKTRRNYRLRLALERITGKLVRETGFTNSNMQHGIETEPRARAVFESLTGHIVQEVGVGVMECGEICASPDGLMAGAGGLELKCVIPGVHLDYMELVNTPPTEYRHQVQGGMYVFGVDRWHFMSFCDDMPIEIQAHIVQVKADYEYLDRLDVGLRKFLRDVRGTVDDIKERIEKARASGLYKVDVHDPFLSQSEPVAAVVVTPEAAPKVIEKSQEDVF